MRMKKERFLPIKEMLFSYLAISKILYWSNTIAAIDQRDLGGVGDAVLTRLLDRDLMLISIVILFYFLEKLIFKKYRDSGILKHIVLYAAGFVGMIGLFYFYTWIVSWFVVVEFPNLGAMLGNSIVWYVVIIIALNVKQYFKSKGEGTSASAPPQGTDNKLAMLKSLLDDGILTQEEFDCKKEKILGMS